jgi:hypothetical protein
MEQKSSLPCSQQSTTEPFMKQTNPYPAALLPKVNFNPLKPNGNCIGYTSYFDNQSRWFFFIYAFHMILGLNGDYFS